MRCECCNKILSSQEATRRFKGSDSFVDMCNQCLDTISDEVETTEGYTGPDDDDDNLWDERDE